MGLRPRWITVNVTRNSNGRIDMKTRATYLRIGYLFCMFIGILSLPAEDRVIVVSPATELNGNLDLAAVAEVFKESESLQDFERALNDPDVLLNNLDLDGDGEVDFIRVLEEEKEEGRLIVLQVIMGENAFADVAYIDIAREDDGEYEMQIRGETSLYGEDYYYIPEKTTISTWPIIVSLYDPFYDYYYSPYSWNHYPDWWQPYGCIRIGLYRAQVIYRYPYRSFRRSYRPWVRDFYSFHHATHRDYTPVIYSHRYSWDYRDRDRRNHDYYNNHRNNDWRDSKNRWDRRDHNDNRWDKGDRDKNRWDKRNRDNDRWDRDDNRKPPRDHDRKNYNPKDGRNDSKDRKSYRTSQKDKPEYNRPIYQPPKTQPQKKQDKPNWTRPPSDRSSPNPPVVTHPRKESPKSYTPPGRAPQPVAKPKPTKRYQSPNPEPPKRVSPPPRSDIPVIKPPVDTRTFEKPREKNTNVSPAQKRQQQRKAQPVPQKR